MERSRYFHLVLVTFLLTFAGGPLRAQETLTLDQALARALRESPRVRALYEKSRAAHARIQQAEAWDDPVFAFEFYSTPIMSLNPFKDGLENDYSLQQMIPFPGKKALMGEMAGAGSRMATFDTETARRDVAMKVTESYGMAWSAQRRLEVLRESGLLLRRMRESAGSAYATGRGSPLEVLRFDLENERLANDSAAAVAELEGALAMLDAACGAPPSAIRPILARPPEIQLPASAEDAVETAMIQRPELAGMQIERGMYGTEAAMWRREMFPDFMIRAMYKEMRFGMHDSWSLMAGINIPIAPWASGKYTGRIEEAEARIRATEADIADMRAMIAAEARERWVAVRSLQSRLARVRNAMLPLAAQTIDVLLPRLQSGTAEYVAVLDAFRMSAMTRMEEAMLEGELTAAIGRLARAMGVQP